MDAEPCADPSVCLWPGPRYYYGDPVPGVCEQDGFCWRKKLADDHQERHVAQVERVRRRLEEASKKSDAKR